MNRKDAKGAKIFWGKSRRKHFEPRRAVEYNGAVVLNGGVEYSEADVGRAGSRRSGLRKARKDTKSSSMKGFRVRKAFEYERGTKSLSTKRDEKHERRGLEPGEVAKRLGGCVG